MPAANQSSPVKDNCIFTKPAFSFMYSTAEDASWILACNDATLQCNASPSLLCSHWHCIYETQGDQNGQSSFLTPFSKILFKMSLSDHMLCSSLICGLLAGFRYILTGLGALNLIVPVSCLNIWCWLNRKKSVSVLSIGKKAMWAGHVLSCLGWCAATLLAMFFLPFNMSTNIRTMILRRDVEDNWDRAVRKHASIKCFGAGYSVRSHFQRASEKLG